MQSLESQSRPLIILRILTGGIGAAILFICLVLLALLGLHSGARDFYLAMEVLVPLGVLGAVASYLGSPWLGFLTGAGLIAASAAALCTAHREAPFVVAFVVFSGIGAGIFWSAARVLASAGRD